jgi:DNA-binding Xre family transcriptional regulator
MNGTLQACALHPGIGQRVLYTLMSLPSSLVWVAVLLLRWRVIRAARQTGPFTVQVAVAMRRLGWLIIAGTAAATVVQGFALDQLLNTMLTPATGSTLARLGEALDCQPGDLLSYEPPAGRATAARSLDELTTRAVPPAGIGPGVTTG